MDEELDEQGQERERVEVKVRKDPGEPTKEEINRHNVTHLPYRSWCPICVKAKGKIRAHLGRHKLLEEELPTVSADYFYMGMEGEEGTVPMIIIKDLHTKCIFTHVIREKGPEEYIVRRFVEDLRLLGYKRLILKTDQEVSLTSLCGRIKELWEGEVVPENSAVGDSQGNGAIESGVAVAGGQIRALKLMLEDRFREEIGSDHAIIPWLVDYAGFLLTRFGIGRDGKTPYKLLKGKDWDMPLYELGECVQYKPQDKPKGRFKLDARLLDGIFLGCSPRSGEMFIGTKNGVIRARDVYRKCEADRWNRDWLHQFRGLPWDMMPEEGGEPEVPRAMRTEGTEEKEKDDDGQVVVPRRAKIKKVDLERYGYTPNCRGCFNSRFGLPARIHSEECRKRIDQRAQEDAENDRRRTMLEAADRRQTEYIAGRVEATDMKHKKEEEQGKTEVENAAENQGDVNMEAEGAGGASSSSTGGTMRRKRRRNEEDAGERMEMLLEELRKFGAEIGGDAVEKLKLENEIPGSKRAPKFGFQVRRISEVSEVYSPPRVIKFAEEYGFQAGIAMDIITQDENGQP